jgi:hypothetical protein
MIIRLFQFIYKVSGEISKKYSKTFQISDSVLADPRPPPTTHWQETYTRLEGRGVGDNSLHNTIMVIKNMTTPFTNFVVCLKVYTKNEQINNILGKINNLRQ